MLEYLQMGRQWSNGVAWVRSNNVSFRRYVTIIYILARQFRFADALI